MVNSAVAVPEDIRRKVWMGLSPWRSSKEKPPFSEEQLVVMAILMSGGEVTEIQVQKWVLHTFSFYRERAAEALWRETRKYRSYGEIADPGHHFRIASIFQNMEVPLNLTLNSDSADTYSITMTEAEYILTPLIFPADTTDTTTCHFFRLPTELRDTIYEMVFGYPKSGIQMNFSIGVPDHNVTPFVAVTESWEQEFSWEAWSNWYGSKKRALRTRPMHEILRPLLVNKQFYTEALPIFYERNHFHCSCIAQLYKLLINMAPSRLQYVRHISFSWDRFRERAAVVFSMLARLKGLRRLDINVCYMPHYTSVIDTKCVKALSSVRGLESVTFHGNPDYEAELKPLMLQSRTEEQLADSGKKRKFNEGEVSDRLKRRRQLFESDTDTQASDW